MGFVGGLSQPLQFFSVHAHSSCEQPALALRIFNAAAGYVKVFGFALNADEGAAKIHARDAVPAPLTSALGVTSSHGAGAPGSGAGSGQPRYARSRQQRVVMPVLRLPPDPQAPRCW